MVPPPLLSSISSPSPPLLLSLAASVSQHVPSISQLQGVASAGMHQLAKREIDKHSAQFAVYAALIPILVLLSGVFAGLTLGYMSLDETQLHVLSISGTPEQRKYAEKIKPIRHNGHLLLVTLLLANMIVNETLPVISDPVLGGGVESVVVSTVLIVIFSEIIPQSICTRHGLYIGAKMAPFVRVLIWGLGIVSWPIAKLLEYLLGPHHGIIYRRAELKELIAMHSSVGELGGDLRSDTVTIIGATLDLQEKTAKQAMTKIEDVFMLSIDAKLDYETLKKVCRTGHSRIPVFEEIEMPDGTGSMIKAKKILGILLVKQCVLLDPNDAVPVRSITLNKVPSVAQNEPLLGILDRFQEGRSHMAIVSRMSVGKAASVKKAVKKNLTQRLKDRVGISDSSSSSDEDEEPQAERTRRSWKTKRRSRKDSDRESTGSSSTDQDATLKGEPDDAEDSGRRSLFRKKRKTRVKIQDVEMGTIEPDADAEPAQTQESSTGLEVIETPVIGEQQARTKLGSFVQLPKLASGFEQSMPADAVLGKQGVDEFLMGYDPLVAPLGIITLEDVLEELIGEEIYDEFDPEGARCAEVSSYLPPSHQKSSMAGLSLPSLKRKVSAPQLSSTGADVTTGTNTPSTTPASAPKPFASPSPMLRLTAPPVLMGFSFLTGRSRSAPPTPRDSQPADEAPPAPETKDAAVPNIVVSPSPSPAPDGSDEGAGTGTARMSSAPSPSLEALLRSRRPAQAAAGGTISRAPTPGSTRGRFKSSPLSGGAGARGTAVGRVDEGDGGEGAKDDGENEKEVLEVTDEKHEDGES